MAAQGTYDTQPPQNITGKVLWSSSDTTIATVSKSGLLQAVKAPGSPTITASLGTISGTATVNIVLTGVTAIAVGPSKTATVRQGGSTNFTCSATVTGQSQPVDITSSATWTTSDTTNTQITNGANPAVFTVNSNTANETVTVTAAYTVGTTTFTDKATVTVTQ
jgi:hypothetical protein